jgi:hypothetical protein
MKLMVEHKKESMRNIIKNKLSGIQTPLVGKKKIHASNNKILVMKQTVPSMKPNSNYSKDWGKSLKSDFISQLSGSSVSEGSVDIEIDDLSKHISYA